MVKLQKAVVFVILLLLWGTSLKPAGGRILDDSPVHQSWKAMDFTC